ncbi:uncharacterized protein LOC129315362 isoform X1 [Prosopis cineraria]|uniref:uncharacterized protein LOC129315362 isoform X1 n=1 Tax=Prosopis cineraria TaxID=364024 RepID=UPI0024105B9F|nr:uncharacterized protein LOC129315362 isoform X1 [Prosopis cineraria]
MEVMKYLYLEGTGIEKLPWSICKLTQLKRLHIGQHKGIELPDSISLLPQLKEMSVYGGENLLSYNHEEAQEKELWSKKCPNMTTFEYRYSNISNDVLRINLARFINVERLDLSGSSFTVLPACVKQCHHLTDILLEECKHLREVEGIPPNLIDLRAKNCFSLSLESRRLLLSEELLAAPHKHSSYVHFEVPGTSIPKWFDICSKGESISFWFRNCFPCLYLSALLKPYVDAVAPWVYINNELVLLCRLRISSQRSDADHIVVESFNIENYQKKQAFRKKFLESCTYSMFIQSDPEASRRVRSLFNETTLRDRTYQIHRSI